MNSRLICIVFSLLIIGNCNAASRRKRVTANAGTGPYNFGPQTGRTQIGPVHARTPEMLRLLDELGKHINSREYDKARKTLKNLQDVLRELNLLGTYQSQIDNINVVLVELTKVRVRLDTPPTKMEIDAAIQNITQLEINVFDQINYLKYDLPKQSRNDERRVSIGSFNAGLFLHESSAYEFNNLIFSSGEHGAINNSSTSYFTAGTYIPLTKEQVGVTGRLGAGVFFGDPYRSVGSFTEAIYLSPFALDMAGTISTLIRPGNAASNEPITRTLVDHIRPGDVWLSLTARQISRTANHLVLANGTMAEAELTFALNKAECNSYKATTISLSGIYSANENLGVDELGAEFRIPIKGHAFFCGRYGTRGNYTVSLDFKL